MVEGLVLIGVVLFVIWGFIHSRNLLLAGECIVFYSKMATVVGLVPMVAALILR